MLSLAWKDWERKASNFPPEVAFQLYSFHWNVLARKMADLAHAHRETRTRCTLEHRDYKRIEWASREKRGTI